MNKEEFLKKIGDIEMIYSLPIFVKNYTKEHHALVQYKMLAFDLEHEIERLNNIINELEEEIYNVVEKMNNSLIKIEGRGYYYQDLLPLECLIYKLKELKENKE